MMSSLTSNLFFISLEIVHNLFLVNLSHFSCSIHNLSHFCILCFKITTLQFLRCLVFACLFFNPFGFSVWAKLILSLSRLSRLFSRHPSPPTTSAALVANLDLPPVPPHEAGWEAAKPAKRSDKVTRFVPRERTERILLTRFKWSHLVCTFTSVCITSSDRGLWTGW